MKITSSKGFTFEYPDTLPTKEAFLEHINPVATKQDAPMWLTRKLADLVGITDTLTPANRLSVLEDALHRLRFSNYDPENPVWSNLRNMTLRVGGYSQLPSDPFKLLGTVTRLLEQLHGTQARPQPIDNSNLPKLLMRVEELRLSVRSANCLSNLDIVYVGELVQCTEGWLLKTKNFGRKSLKEIKETLAQHNLCLYTVLDEIALQALKDKHAADRQEEKPR